MIDELEVGRPVAPKMRVAFEANPGCYLAVFDQIEAFYNSRRRHSALGCLSPAEYERRYRSETIAA